LAVAKEEEEEEEEERKGAKIRVFIFCVPFVSVTRFVAAVFHGSTFLTTSLFYLSHALTTKKNKITCLLGQLEMHPVSPARNETPSSGWNLLFSFSPELQ
jgi:hypothetical protein